jgi:hypothetical protein
MRPLFWNGRDTVPAAVAVKAKNSQRGHLRSDAFADLEIMIGSTAASYIQRNSRMGLESPLLTVVSDNKSLATSPFLTPMEYLALYGWQLLRKYPAPQSIALTYPCMLTGTQTNRLTNAFRYFRVPISKVYDDITVMSTLYVNTQFPRIVNKPEWHVMFIDCGGTYFKCFVQNFTIQENYTESQTMALEWSDTAGGTAFVRALAKDTRLTIKDAQTLLKDYGENREFATAELFEMKKVMSEVLRVTGPVDEFQIYGGLSQLKFVYEVLDSFAQSHYAPLNHSEVAARTGQVPDIDEVPHIRQDFDANLAVLRGTLFMMSMEQNFTEFIPTVRTAKPIVSYFVEWGTQKEKYCQKNFNCRYPNFEFRNETNEIVITADPRHVTPGGPIVVNKYRMTNMTSVPFNESAPGRLLIQLAFPEPVIEFVFHAAANGSFTRIGFEPMSHNADEIDKSYKFFGDVIEELAQRDAKDARVEMIRIAVEKMDSALSPRDFSDPRKTQIYEQIDEYKQKVQDGTYRRLSMAALKKVIQEIELVATVLGFKVES